MADAGGPTLLLLPSRERLAGHALPPLLARALGRADMSPTDGDQLARLIDVLPHGWPAAAVTRQRDVGDAAGSLWLRADPAYVRPDINGARLLAWGEAFGLTPADAESLLKPLRPLFGDAGFLLDAPQATRWYLRLPAGTRLPKLASPDQALGADLFEHLPEDVDAGTGEGRRWRTLLGEAQVVLHNHPLNERRIASGFAPVNSLWFWGGGMLPDRVTCASPQVATDDDAIAAFAALASTPVLPLPDRWTGEPGAFDLRAVRDSARLVDDWIGPACDAALSGRVASTVLDFADGARFELRRRQRWRFWRRPLAAVARSGDTPA